jgi:hypothetical protein
MIVRSSDDDEVASLNVVELLAPAFFGADRPFPRAGDAVGNVGESPGLCDGAGEDSSEGPEEGDCEGTGLEVCVGEGVELGEEESFGDGSALATPGSPTDVRAKTRTSAICQ